MRTPIVDVSARQHSKVAAYLEAYRAWRRARLAADGEGLEETEASGVALGRRMAAEEELLAHLRFDLGVRSYHWMPPYAGQPLVNR